MAVFSIPFRTAGHKRPARRAQPVIPHGSGLAIPPLENLGSGLPPRRPARAKIPIAPPGWRPFPETCPTPEKNATPIKNWQANFATCLISKYRKNWHARKLACALPQRHSHLMQPTGIDAGIKLARKVMSASRSSTQHRQHTYGYHEKNPGDHHPQPA